MGLAYLAASIVVVVFGFGIANVSTLDMRDAANMPFLIPLAAIVIIAGVSLLYFVLQFGGQSTDAKKIETKKAGHPHHTGTENNLSSLSATNNNQENSSSNSSGSDVLIDTSKFSASFIERLEHLREFKNRVGHAEVPLDSASRSDETPKGLGNWVYKQRKLNDNNKLKPEQVAALSALDFRWQLNVDELDWKEMTTRLLAYKEAEGHTLVPKKYELDPQLGAWVCDSRRKADKIYNGGKSLLTAEETDMLNAVGFSWQPAKRCGSAFMRGLREYADAHAANEPLPEQWCNAQREAKAKGKLSDQRISYLDKFSFDWDISSDAKTTIE